MTNNVLPLKAEQINKKFEKNEGEIQIPKLSLQLVLKP